MNIINEFINSNMFLIILAVINLILLILYICNIIKTSKINKNYKKFMKKLGNGNDLEEMMKKYIEKSEYIENQNKEIICFCEKLDNNISECIKKIGIVRYNAFKDTGSDLSFALALLNDNNNGIVLNGIYSREMSNIYAKKIMNGESIHQLSDEEKQAIKIAMNK